MIELSELQKTANDKIDLIAEKFITSEVISCIESSTSFGRIIASRDPLEFMDIPLIQWDTCTANILCLLKKQFKEEKIAVRQSLLIRICKIAAREIYRRHKVTGKIVS